MDIQHPAVQAITLTAAIVFTTVIVLRWRRPCIIHSLQNKHVVITGGSSGIGLEIAKEAVAQGCYVTLVARNLSNLQKAAEEILKEGHCDQDRINVKVADISDYEAISAAIHESSEWRPLDILVCNAGVTCISYLDQLPIDRIASTVQTNITGTLYTLRAALPLMKQRSSRHCRLALVFMGSLASLYPLYGSGLYTTTKYALRGLAETLRPELLPYNIGVTLVCPGFVETSMLKEIEDKTSDPEFYKIRSKTSFYKRSRAEAPREVAKATLRAAKQGRFLATTGIKGFMLSILSTGLFPADSFGRALIELFLFLPVKVISYIISAYIYAVIWLNHTCK